MAGVLRFSRQDAAALPLTPETVETVIARTRTANLAQMLKHREHKCGGLA